MTPDQMRDASMLELFQGEGEVEAEVVKAGLVALERNPTQADQLEACMRAAHSLKGAARIVGVDAGVSIAHVMEDCLVSAQEGRLRLTPDHIDALLKGTDLLLRVAKPESGVTPAEISAFVEQMDIMSRGGFIAMQESQVVSPAAPSFGPPEVAVPSVPEPVFVALEPEVPAPVADEAPVADA